MKKLALLFLALSLWASKPLAQEKPVSSFLPVWKLMTREQKEQFVAGYLEGWREAAGVTDIAIEYVRANPEGALDGLERLRSIYDISGLKPGFTTDAIEQFYSKPENAQAPLSVAVTAAKNR